jgi:outer membrane protein assembly factor BamB
MMSAGGVHTPVLAVVLIFAPPPGTCALPGTRQRPDALPEGRCPGPPLDLRRLPDHIVAVAEASTHWLPHMAQHSNAATERPSGQTGSLLDRITLTACLLAALFLFFVLGAWVVLAQVFPYPWLAQAYEGGKALWAKETEYLDPYRTDFWKPARTAATGVIRHDPARAQQGLTLYTSGHEARADLVAMDGEVVHTWQLPFSAVWDATSPVSDPQPDDYIYWRKAMVYPNGDLLAIYVAAGDSPWGYGLVRIDKDSQLVWKYLEQAHHDVDIGEDGRIYALTHEIRDNEYRDFPQLAVPRIDDFVVVLSPDGQELQKVSIADALIDSPYARLLTRVVWYTKGDYLHNNGIDVVEADAAAALALGPFVRPGQVLLSIREIDTIALLDLEQERIAWALRGPWLAQHDPDILANGNMLLFDNLGNFLDAAGNDAEGGGGRSRIIEFDPATTEIVWQYAGTPEEPFESDVRASQERLANGNTLVTEETGGRIIEVTPDGEIVWEFVNPVRAEGRGENGGDMIPIVSWAQRIDPASLDADFLAR